MHDLKKYNRLTLKQQLVPENSSCFQLPSFQDIGNAVAMRPDGIQVGIVDTHGSVANRLEAAIWNGPNLIDCCDEIPYVEVLSPNGRLITNSHLESHRLNSPYVFKSKMQDGKLFEDYLGELLIKADADWVETAKIFAKYDPCSLIHGTFLSYSQKMKVRGVGTKVTRSLSGFIEAINVVPMDYGTGKHDRVHSCNSDNGGYGKSNQGFGTFQTSAKLWMADEIVAGFFLDIDLLRSYCLGDTFLDWAIALSLLKIYRFLMYGTRLRTNCILAPVLTKDDQLDLRIQSPLPLKNQIQSLDEATLEATVKALTGRLIDQKIFGEQIKLVDGVTNQE